MFAHEDDYDQFAADTIRQMRRTFPGVRLRSFAEFSAFLTPLIPKLVHKYILFAGTMKNCSGASGDFAEIGAQAGFPTLVRAVPGHQYNVVLTTEGPYMVDLTAIQFLCKHDLRSDDPEEREEARRNYRELRLHPERAVKIERLPRQAFYDTRLPVGEYHVGWPDPAAGLLKYNPSKTEKFFPETFSWYEQGSQETAMERKSGRSVGRVTVARIDIVQIEQGHPFEAYERSLGAAEPESAEHPFASYEAGAAEAPGANCVILKDGRVERSPDCMPTDVQLRNEKDVYRIMRPYFQKRGSEEFYILGATLQQEMVGQPVLVAVGQTSSVRVSVSQCLVAALGLHAGAACEFWAVHGHPSDSNDEHSDMDKELTKKLRKGFEASFPECKFRGHVVVGRDGFTVS